MKQTIIHAGFHPEVKREYKGEHIYKVINTRTGGESREFHSGAVTSGSGRYFGLDNGAWIKEVGPDKYQTDWTDEERWGRVEEVETDDAGNVLSSETLGFMILRVDRRNGLL